MFDSTLRFLKCPTRSGRCGGELALSVEERSGKDVVFGELRCARCEGRYPILAGVAIVVPDVASYCLEHVKGISQRVPDERIPEDFREAFSEAREEIEEGHIDEDLESARTNALYVMTHYLAASGERWWASRDGEASPFIEQTIREHWDRGPFARIREELASGAAAGRRSLVELGCGTGGLLAATAPLLKSYLGVDSSFAGIALARHLALGAPLDGALLFPADLLDGAVSRELAVPRPKLEGVEADFVVCDATDPALREGEWDLAASLNMIDMLDEPASLPALQHALLRAGGVAIQSCPYIWHPAVAEGLRESLPPEIRDSAGAVEWLYAQAGFQIGRSVRHVPWLFFKHLRQLEIYSVHLFFAEKR